MAISFLRSALAPPRRSTVVKQALKSKTHTWQGNMDEKISEVVDHAQKRVRSMQLDFFSFFEDFRRFAFDFEVFGKIRIEF